MNVEEICRALVKRLLDDPGLAKNTEPFMLDKRCYVLELREVTPEEWCQTTLEENRG